MPPSWLTTRMKALRIRPKLWPRASASWRETGRTIFDTSAGTAARFTLITAETAVGVPGVPAGSFRSRSRLGRREVAGAGGQCDASSALVRFRAAGREGDRAMGDGTEETSPHGRGRRRQGELEKQVLSALGSAPGPVTAAWVQRQLGLDRAELRARGGRSLRQGQRGVAVPAGRRPWTAWKPARRRARRSSRVPGRRQAARAGGVRLRGAGTTQVWTRPASGFTISLPWDWGTGPQQFRPTEQRSREREGVSDPSWVSLPVRTVPPPARTM